MEQEMSKLEGNAPAGIPIPTQSSEEESEKNDIFGEPFSKQKKKEKGLSQKEFDHLKTNLTERLKPLVPVSFKQLESEMM